MTKTNKFGKMTLYGFIDGFIQITLFLAIIVVFIASIWHCLEWFFK